MLAPGQHIRDRYLLQNRLGNTAASRQTWLSLDTHHNNEPVIVKLLAFHPQMQLDELKLFEREAQILQTLDHPRIPKYRDYFSEEQDVLWFGLVQDYIPGLSLQDRLNRGDIFSEDDVRQIALCLLPILGYLHQQDPPVLHRDIKPSNIVWGKDGQVYLIDFGAVQNQAALTGVTFTVVGSSGYAPLEQFWGRAVPASDLYALGATLIYLLSTIPPADLPQRNGGLKLPDAVFVSPFFKAWLEKMVEPLQEQRFTSAEAALESLRHQTLPTLADPPRRLQKPASSRIRVHVTAGGQTIVMPMFSGGTIAVHGLTVGILALIGSFILVPIVFLSSSFPLFTAIAAWLRVDLSLLCFIGAVVLAIAITLLLLGEKTEIHLERDRLSLYRTTFGIPLRRRFLPRKNILGVFWLRSVVSNALALRLEAESLRLRNGLSETECLWLIQEIQDWLNNR